MRLRLLSFALVISLTPLLAPAQEKADNPFWNAKVGDYVTYKQITTFLGNDIEISMKQAVSAKNDKEVTLKTTASVKGKALPSHDTRIDLTRPHDPVSAALQGKFDKTGAGKDQIKIGDKTYDCDWVAGTLVAADGKRKSDVKIWFSKSVPLTGRVKMETKSNMGEVTKMEITGWGNMK